MLTEAELLNDIYRTTEMGRDGIETVLPHSEEGPFRAALEQQLALVPGIRKVTCLNVDEPEEPDEPEA